MFIFAFIGGALLLGFNVIFNIKSSHHHITTFIPDNFSKHEPSKHMTSTEAINVNSNGTNNLIQTMNNKLKQSENNNKTKTNCDVLFCDKHNFDSMVSYYTQISSLNTTSS